jgi:O-acetyl-ADP-ribose deacetylase (regulator of RNase III)
MYQIINGDLLLATEPIIVHQLNCLCVKGQGLSSTIAKKYPYADVYATRKVKYGNICIEEDEGKIGEIVVSKGILSQPIVIGLYGQYDYGKGGGSRRTSYKKDNHILREAWFKTCLLNLAKYMKLNEYNSVAFPYGIGCGLAGGNWIVYEKMIQDFTESNGFNVSVYKI